MRFAFHHIAECQNKGSAFNCRVLLCFAFNKCYFQGNWLQLLAKYIRFSMFEEAQLFVGQNREVLYGQKKMRKKVACFCQFSFS